MNRIITVNDLVEYNPCGTGLDWFAKQFPDGVEIQRDIIIHEHDQYIDGSYIVWFYNTVMGNMSCDSSSQEVFYTCKYVLQNGYQKTYFFNEAGLQIRSEDSNGFWVTYEYNEAGQKTRYEQSTGYWQTRQYNEAGLETWFERSYGYWKTRQYNEAGQVIRIEDSDGSLETWSYNEAGEVIDYTSE